MKFISTLLTLLFSFILQAQSFETYFKDETIRLDFVFQGNKNQTKTILNPLVSTGKWYGRKVNLGENLLQGDAEIVVYGLKSKKIIYTQSFSSLYFEWLTQKSANKEIFTQEQVLYIPFPKENFKVVLNKFEKNKPVKIYEQTFDLSNKNLIKVDNSEIKFKELHKATETYSPINVAIVAEGFTKEEMPIFEKYAQKTLNSLFNHKAFKNHTDKFNIYAVLAESKDSGVSSPSKNKNINTVAQSNFDTFGYERYLTTSKIFKLHNELAGLSADHIIIIANTNIYGGGGIYNAYTLTSIYDQTFDAVVVHEFGHSFAGLADEYFYEDDIFSNTIPLDIEPWNKNNTTLVNFDSKWKNKLANDTPIPTDATLFKDDRVGVYEGIKNGKVYIPHQNCRMHTNEAHDFCSVCTDAIEELILFYTKQK